jgi:hypothetical protein
VILGRDFSAACDSAACGVSPNPRLFLAFSARTYEACLEQEKLLANFFKTHYFAEITGNHKKRWLKVFMEKKFSKKHTSVTYVPIW